MKWYDFFKVFTYSFADDPLSRKHDKKNLSGAGISQPGAINIRSGDGLTAGSGAFIRVANDLVDVQSATSRMNRMREYQRLVECVPEIDRAMTVFSDEACVAGNTKIATVFDGYQTIEWLTHNKVGKRFPVYCYDFEKNDYTVGWAFEPRLVKHAETIQIDFEDGVRAIVTPDHRILKSNGVWTQACELIEDDELMPFYRVRPMQEFTNQVEKQFPRIFTNKKGWIHERQFIDEWRLNCDLEEYVKINRICNLALNGMIIEHIADAMQNNRSTIQANLAKSGFSIREMQYLAKKPKTRRIIGVHEGKVIPVYDLSVEKYENFCTNSVVMHNCQKDEKKRVFKVACENEEVVSELEYMFFNRERLNFNQRTIWDKFRRMLIKGDSFWECIIDPDDPKNGLCGLQDLQPETMFRIETTKARLIEFQQSNEGPDYKAVENTPIEIASDSDLSTSTTIRFAPKQIIHIRLGDYRKNFYPYGVSLIEPARGPAHTLMTMEESMVVYRLCVRSYDKLKTPDGWKYMKDVSVNDTVFSYNQETKKLEQAKVIWHELVGQKQTFKVKSKHTSVTGTGAHPILVYDKDNKTTDYIKIKDLKPNVHCFLHPHSEDFEPKKIERYYKEEWVALTQEQKNKYKTGVYADKKVLIQESFLNVGEVVNKKTANKCWSFFCSKGSLPAKIGNEICKNFALGDPIRKNKGEIYPELVNLPTYVTEEFASLFGFLLGDGCISWHHNSKKLLFAAGVHKEINERYSGLLIKYFGRCKFQQDKRIGEGLGGYCVNSLTVCEIFRNLGYVGDAYTKRIPEWVFKERKEIRKAFVLGFADADGTKRDMAKDPWRTTIRLCNKNLVEDIKELWESLGYHASEVKKIDVAEKWFKNSHVLATTHWEVYISETEVPFHDEIVSITEEGIEDVWDLTIDYDHEHNFLCNGVPVSNSRAPERRIFYIDIGQLPPFKAEAFMDRIKDQFRKKKVARRNNASSGASAVEERYSPPSADEDIWLPLRPNSNTRIETLPGAQNLGEIDDTVYFRNKLFTALNFPPNYFANEDPQSTRITLSAQNVQFAMLIERLQSYFEEALWEIADRHLTLRGFPPECYEDLDITMTPPSAWREMNQAEIKGNRINNANSIKGSGLMSDFDILTEWMMYPEAKAKEMISRNKVQKLEDLKLQVIAQNPEMMGVGIPGQGEEEVGSEPGGPTGETPEQPQNPSVPSPSFQKEEPSTGPSMMPSEDQGKPLPDPTDEEIMTYDLEILDYESEQDEEDIDYSELER